LSRPQTRKRALPGLGWAPGIEGSPSHAVPGGKERVCGIDRRLRAHGDKESPYPERVGLDASLGRRRLGPANCSPCLMPGMASSESESADCIHSPLVEIGIVEQGEMDVSADRSSFGVVEEELGGMLPALAKLGAIVSEGRHIVGRRADGAQDAAVLDRERLAELLGGVRARQQQHAPSRHLFQLRPLKPFRQLRFTCGLGNLKGRRSPIGVDVGRSSQNNAVERTRTSGHHHGSRVVRRCGRPAPCRTPRSRDHLCRRQNRWAELESHQLIQETRLANCRARAGGAVRRGVRCQSMGEPTYTRSLKF
jgi:hypothetical protein